MGVRQQISAILFLGCMLITVAIGQSTPSVMAQEPVSELDQRVEEVFNQLTPVERVGQLFIATFDGPTAVESSRIASLIRDYRLGGVWLQPSNKPDAGTRLEAALAMQTLINTLQGYTYQPPRPLLPAPVLGAVSNALTATGPITSTQVTQTATQEPGTETASAAETAFTPLPLFIATDHEGGGYPYTLLVPELTHVPSEMVLGSTWKPEYARQVGLIVGEELSVIGVNMLFGPVLDVVDRPRPDIPGAIGIRSFGGDFFWVGMMGQAYIAGAHEGSGGQLLTIAKHFPGAGSIDRQLNQDVPTIQKIAAALEQIELAPFYSVTSQEKGNPAEITDGLMTAHIRYKGLQENVRELTQPISLDAQNLPLILNSPQIAPWREQGGLVVSGPLGAPAIIKSYSTNGNFPAIQVARNAFLAGNDILLLSTFGPADDPDAQFRNIITVLEFFQSDYAEDAEFQQRVDASVKRILRAKLRLYDDFSAENVLDKAEDVTNLPNRNDSLTNIIRESATLIFPGPAELADRIPSPPLRDEMLVIFTDDRQGQRCPTCDEFYLLDPLALQNAMLARYGPDAGNQISEDQVSSFTFTELANALLNHEATSATNQVVNQAIEQADWVIFAMLDVNENYPQSSAVKQFLRERSLDLRGKKLIVLAFDAPYFLDNTEVSILTAYYGLYNRTPKFVDTAVRLLFKEFQPQGHSPVSIDAVEYDLNKVVEPSPDQVIALTAAKETAVATENGTPTTTTTANAGETPQPDGPVCEVGDRCIIRTGVIVDHNGNPVPDDTIVLFKPTLDGLELAPISESTVNGVAETVVPVAQGVLEITVESGQARQSAKVIIEGSTTTIETPTPTETPSPTSTPEPTATKLPSPTPRPTLTPLPEPSPPPALDPPPQQASILMPPDLLYSLLALIASGLVFILVLIPYHLPVETRTWLVLMMFAGGLVGYVLYGIFALQLAEVEIIGDLVRFNTTVHWLTPLVSFIFALCGSGMGAATIYFRQKRSRFPFSKMRGSEKEV